ncbi:surface antigen-like protein [Leptomonas pyrrhocoris]|uniref:Surface antigen-like protein n=1 Tax=Leptomonas pyrrhocoris TaxID=157538 RepID=A0A0M9FX06_LEPPY|nr:surface antigen-like protein [Leptomonas pyrrhocoris]KPA77626.1 surface antigen-like protein [Leptomonas pyrrhocoris]|eukprot:XP_015656065.1 surface antigen-like protein [Leptomonas pyrrhocoris]
MSALIRDRQMRRLALTVAAALLLCLLPSRADQPPCQVPNCRTCAADNEFFCEVCSRPEFIHANGQCSPRGTCSITACEKCEEGTISRCQTCEPGYVRAVNGLCASLVECEMDKCTSREELRDRIAQTTVQCSVADTVKEKGVYVCVASKGGGGSVAAGSFWQRAPWWLYATVTTGAAVGLGSWIVSRRRSKA